ncbi:hypothetical protein H2198_000778 [Neophaeococcomyces mojaviensis]|uniref:Uncharacterized protein n=1 Tax=Neophaeococcomyces mojaviensis TaxID=3383035 RepID=A0ACC3AJT2_9EURO|nr:hypothetical protein H2198_000778 [Knufia sp. JES_112]
MSTASPPRNRNDFKVAIICALPLEASSVQSVFDICWEDEGKQYGKVKGDQNFYSTGVIGMHNVVLAHMPGTGNTDASGVATGIRTSFTSIELALVVGICGVVPQHSATPEDIVLGDIIISTDVIHYDVGKQYPSGFRKKKEIGDSLGRASLEIRSFISMLQTPRPLKRLTESFALLIHSEQFQKEVPAAKYPVTVQDRLYEASYAH